MESPSPVPPYLRVVEVSACEKAWKSRALCSGVMPIPLSRTENFTFTGDRDMNAATNSILLPMQLGFPPTQASHLIGIGDYTTPWLREVRAAKGRGVESVVLFALDQFCLIGYPAPLKRSRRRSLFMSQ